MLELRIVKTLETVLAREVVCLFVLNFVITMSCPIYSDIAIPVRKKKVFS